MLLLSISAAALATPSTGPELVFTTRWITRLNVSNDSSVWPLLVCPAIMRVSNFGQSMLIVFKSFVGIRGVCRAHRRLEISAAYSNRAHLHVRAWALLFLPILFVIVHILA